MHGAVECLTDLRELAVLYEAQHGAVESLTDLRELAVL